ncbi:MAG: response regulator transcription factor [Candidatus Tectomicrobia bacterium]|uniref:Response regulator transcription factor n=1 Tax=Tectimicrobiota bacterium TaxID=2528274 RepID=A0A933GNK0_UNCTE|nr:response regulator transcription factor [Candidatus Tectomicrobia bacterium]
MKKKEKIRLLLVDDHPIILEGIRACLAEHEDIEIIGEALNGEEAIQKATELSPDVVLMDISLPGMNGIEVTQFLQREVPQTKILAFTMYNSKQYVLSSIRSGARGYVLKDTSPSELVLAIKSIYVGGSFFSSRASQAVLEGFVKESETEEKSDKVALTKREKEVLTLIAQGVSNKEIANRLFVSVRTIETHREHIMSKLNVHTVAELTMYAIAKGLLQVQA